MTNAATRRPEIEGLIREWFQLMTPEERASEGSKLLGFVSARLAFHCERRSVAEILWTLGDQVVIGSRPDRDPT